jgi:hypothetical protein
MTPPRFGFYTQVRIARPHPENFEFAGELGVVFGLGTEPGEPVSVGVFLEKSERVVCFAEDELVATGRQFCREDFYDDRQAVRVRVDEHGRGHIV